MLDSLDEIHFSLKKANQVIRDITRRIATDKCVSCSLAESHTCQRVIVNLCCTS